VLIIRILVKIQSIFYVCFVDKQLSSAPRWNAYPEAIRYINSQNSMVLLLCVYENTLPTLKYAEALKPKVKFVFCCCNSNHFLDSVIRNNLYSKLYNKITSPRRYGRTRISRHAKFSTNNWNSRNYDIDIVFLKKANTKSVNRLAN
jgi:hypothetical protein